ncbi:hypothetical protein FZI91_05660 [Mycobacterium sp. CBMA271]|nr:hypothetical protein [Mycobacteroides sp. CBMA 271]
MIETSSVSGALMERPCGTRLLIIGAKSICQLPCESRCAELEFVKSHWCAIRFTDAKSARNCGPRVYPAVSSATCVSLTREPCFLPSDTIWAVSSSAIARWTFGSAAAGAASAT